MIYLDNAATTPLDEAVLRKMLPYMSEKFGNPQSQHAAGREAANAVICARDSVARVLGCKAEEVYFVSGGTEAANTALKGICLARGIKNGIMNGLKGGLKCGGHLVISAIEHPCVTESAEDMKKLGFEVTYVRPDERGIIHPEDIERAMRPDTVFCAVMKANNEIGTVQSTKEIGEICRKRGVFYYCDCVQAAGWLPLEAQNCDGMGISSHKFYGPRGAGVLYIKNGSRISRLISGGMQERGFRGGTLNAAAAVGLAEALTVAERDREENCRNVKAVRDRFVNRVLTEIGGAHLNGDEECRLVSNANISFDGCNGENILFLLDMQGVCVSTGSACSAGAVEPSHVLTAMGLDTQRVKGAVRFTFGKYNTLEEADFAVNALKTAVEKIRG